MRAIQFKAKVIEPKNGVPLATSAPVGTWVFGDLHFFHRVPHIHHNGGGRSAIDIETICQYTGLHDKKARDIYEGDIVQWDKDQKLYVVEFRNGMFYASVEPCNPRVYGGFPLWFLCEEDQHCSIVGDRFDNKELLKEGRTMKILDIVHVIGRGYIFIGHPDAAIHIGDKMRFNDQEFNISGIEISPGAKSVGLVLSHSEAAYKIIHKGDEVEIITTPARGQVPDIQ